MNHLQFCCRCNVSSIRLEIVKEKKDIFCNLLSFTASLQIAKVMEGAMEIGHPPVLQPNGKDYLGSCFP